MAYVEGFHFKVIDAHIRNSAFYSYIFLRNLIVVKLLAQYIFRLQELNSVERHILADNMENNLAANFLAGRKGYIRLLCSLFDMLERRPRRRYFVNVQLSVRNKQLALVEINIIECHRTTVGRRSRKGVNFGQSRTIHKHAKAYLFKIFGQSNGR